MKNNYVIGKITENTIMIDTGTVYSEFDYAEKDIIEKTLNNTHDYCILEVVYIYKKKISVEKL